VISNLWGSYYQRPLPEFILTAKRPARGAPLQGAFCGNVNEGPTAALIRKEAGDDLQTISIFLGHSDLSITQIYLYKIESHQDASWLKVESLLGLS